MEFKYDPAQGGFRVNPGGGQPKQPKEKKPRRAVGSKGARVAVFKF